ncbi:putative Response regulator receiver modulated diguanylate cyclase/phosphodiesterase [Vibrio nigripulchritudo SOn1]|uniref:Response regulator receiver modulated diguanylate cyclase/phosphodiesterase n=1 Tax=Vibrio nigripulchritudo SOn1 TaxID=1238450 RepID=A0AAV2VKI1_9VIBR|nr:GGDEF domain-containing response regulator [Vibrio nigripulchritudo]CCO45148.1 putative Response regulator receiver modulated diguanylate cyclase/phosphodiesterase [Vibrio nigripulchritudo SOn1]
MDILIIDDDTVDIISAIRALNETNLPLGIIDQAQTPDEGLLKATSHHYDVILLDYNLPSCNGLHVLQSLREVTEFSTSIVMLSHSNEEDLALQCISCGAQDFMTKSEITAVRLRRAIMIATQRYQLEKQIQHTHNELKRLAEKDSLTGLNNRYTFDEMLKKAIAFAHRLKSPLMLLLLDLDKFKDVNDSLGHLVGDDVLKEVARRLEGCCRETDILSRIGGDEFAIVIQNLHVNVHVLVQRLQSAFIEPLRVSGHTIDLSISIGIASYPDCANNPVELIQCADVSLYKAKALGRNQVQYYSKTFHKYIEKRIQIESDLKNALVNNEFELYYQPQFDLNSSVVGMEALIRWHHPQLGLVPPDEFIPIAEESGLMVNIGLWVIEAALHQLSIWRQETPLASQLSLAINVSARQLNEPDFCTRLLDYLSLYRIPSQKIELEITESSLISGGRASESLQEIHAQGIQIAIDDFGTGYSSLSHLKLYPIDVIKIDKSFVHDLSDVASRKLFTAICSFAHSLEYATVAEGIETQSQLEICQATGVTRLQGYYFAKPLPADDFKAQCL